MKSKLLLFALLAITFPVLADTPDTLTYGADDAPAKGQLKRPGPLPEPLGRIFPDLPMEFKDHITLKEAAFSLTPGLVLLADYTHFSQDAESVEQVGIQDSAWESRAARLILRGHVGRTYKVNYLWSLEYNGLKYLDTQLW